MTKEILDDELIKKKVIFYNDLIFWDRWKSMLLDHAIFCFTVLPVFLFLYKAVIPEKYTFIGFYFLFGIYLNKDFLKGRSIAKRILGQVVIDLETGKPASERKCSIRNFTVILWPFEVLFAAFSPNRRIGDLIAGTIVMRTEKKEIRNWFNDLQKLNKRKSLIAFSIAVVYIWTFFFVYEQFLRPLIWPY